MPGIYTKLITVDKVDLLLGPYATNFVAPAMPTIMQHNKMTFSLTAIGINRHFNYPKYFSMVSVGPDGVNAFSKGFFEIAAQQKPKPQTVAILAADAEFARSASDGAREELKKHGFRLIYDQSYPPPTTDFTPMVRAIQAANPDIVYVAAYPPDNVGIIRAANEIGLTPKMFGGAMIGMLITPIRVQLGPVANGLVISETFLPSPKLKFAGLDDLMKRYQAKAPELKTDPIGYAFVPMGYAAGQILAKAVDRDEDPRSRQARRLCAQEQLRDRGRTDFVRQGRRMVGGAPVHDPAPERRSRTISTSSATARRRRSCGRPTTRAATSSIPTPTRGRSRRLTAQQAAAEMRRLRSTMFPGSARFVRKERIASAFDSDARAEILS